MLNIPPEHPINNDQMAPNSTLSTKKKQKARPTSLLRAGQKATMMAEAAPEQLECYN